MSPLKFWFKSRLKSTGKLLFLQLISVCLSITSYLSSLSTAYQSFFVPFSVGTLIYLSSITIFLVSFVHRLKLPLPNGFNVEKVFGKYQIPPSNAGTGAFPQDESACRCHYFKNHTEKGKLSESRLCSVPPSHNLGLTTIGHRGAGKDAPENSLAAIRKCASNGCSMVELDVTLTKDYVPVLFHDDNLQRIMGVDRMMSEVNWEDLKEMTISEQYPAERVPKLEEAMELCLSLGLRFIIDIKEEHKKLIDSIVNAFQKYGHFAYSSGVVSSFDFRVIYKIRTRDPNIIGCMAWRPAYFALPRFASQGKLSSKPHWVTDIAATLSKIATSLVYGTNDFAMNYIYWWLLGLTAVLVHKDALNVETVERLQQKGLRVYAWTVNCPVEKTYFLQKLHIGYLTDTLIDVDHINPSENN